MKMSSGVHNDYDDDMGIIILRFSQFAYNWSECDVSFIILFIMYLVQSINDINIYVSDFSSF